MKKNKKIDQTKLKEFFEETEKLKDKCDNVDSTESNKPISSYDVPHYRCPKCSKPLYNRKAPCPYCNYNGYIPMSNTDTKRIRTILFIIIMIVAIVVYIITR